MLGPAYDEIIDKVSDGLGLRKDYYKSIPSLKWVQGDLKNFIESKFLFIIRNDHWKNIIYNIIKDSKGLPVSNGYDILDKYGQYTSDLVFSYKRPDSLDEMAKNFQVPNYVNSCKVMAYFKNNIQNDTYNCLVSVIKYLKKQKVRLIFITTPVYKSFTEYYDKKYLDLMEKDMQKLKKEYSVEYYDFSRDTTFSNNNEYFYNSDHLNKTGAKEFSKKLLPIFNKNSNDER